MVFQQFNLFPHKTVLQNLHNGAHKAEGLDPEDAEARALVLLKKSRHRDKANVYPAHAQAASSSVAIRRALPCAAGDLCF